MQFPTAAAGLVFLIFGSAYGSQTANVRKRADSSQDVDASSFVFRQALPILRNKSRVPPRLPSFLPNVDAQHPVYAVLQSVTRSKYDILLAVELPCEGQNNCLYGSIQGSASPFHAEDEKAPAGVKLRSGIRGEFVESVCHAYCTEAYIRWKEDGFYYAIGIKAESKENLIKAANSAVDLRLNVQER